MKKVIYLLGLGLAIFATNTYGQITINQADMPKANTVVALDSDLTPSVTPGSAGASQTWDFTGLHATKTETIDFVTPASTPYANSFPGADLADSSVGYPGYNYFSSQPGYFSIIGGMPIILGYQVNIHFTPYYEQIALPGTFGSTDGGTTRGITNAVPFSYLGSDSGKGNISITYTDTIDAWGTMQMPSGSYSVLRQKHYEVDEDSVFLHYSFPKSQWVFAQTQTMKIYQYRWYTNSIGYMLAQMQMDTTNTKVGSVAWYTTPNGIDEVGNANRTLVYPNPCSTQVNFSCSDKEAGTITVFDIAGRRITGAAVKNGIASMNTSLFAKGIYFYTTATSSGAIIGRGKFIVQ